MPAFPPAACTQAPNLVLDPNAVGLERLQGLLVSRAHGVYLG